MENRICFGPVPSRRLGFSLGIDIIPYKVCSFDCIYCQLGKTTKKTMERKRYKDITNLKTELSDIIRKGIQIDYITLN